MSEPQTAATKSLFSRVGKSALEAVVRAAGSRRILRVVQSVEPKLVGAWSVSDYSRHLSDADFVNAEKLTRPHTLVDRLRMHEIWVMVGQSAKLGDGNILEVGVWRGGTGLLIAEAMRHFGVCGTLYLADTFAGVVKAGVNDGSYTGGEHADTSLGYVEDLFKTHRHDVRILTGIFPDETGHLFAGTIKLLHIDVDIYQSAREIVEWAFDRVVPGGIVIFDDYGFSTTDGIGRLCEEYESDDRFVFLSNVNGHAILIKR